jgi:hypothetical protein
MAISTPNYTLCNLCFNLLPLHHQTRCNLAGLMQSH